jgi:hypothetical protein
MSYQPLFLGLGTAVVSTSADTNYLQGDTTNLRLGQALLFQSEGNNTAFGGVPTNAIFYVKQIVDADNFTISASVDGAVLELTDGTGFMIAKSVQREGTGESLRKLDVMLKEIYTVGLEGDGVGILSVQDDASPTLGGNLSLGGNDIVGTGDINITGTINATVVSGNLRGVVAGGLIGPVDAQGVRTGNPTIDGLPFELGNPQGGQVISWDAPNEKFTLVSVSAVSGSDTLDDVLFRGNTSLNSITVGRAITPEVEGATDELNIYSNWAKDTGISIYSVTDLESVTLTSDRIVAVVTNVGPSQKQWIFETDGRLRLPASGDIINSTGTSVLTSDYNNLINKPTLFSGSYADLTNKPTLFSGSYADLTNKPALFSGSFVDLTNLPNIAEDIGDLTDITNIIPTQLTDLGITDGSAGQVLTTNGAGSFSFTTVSGGGGTGLGSRTTASATTGALAIDATGNISITGFKTYALLGMTVEIPAWVRLYTTAAARTADASRLETTDPLPGTGVIAEVITTSLNQTVSFTPATLGFNGDTPAATTIYASVKNKGSGVATIQVTLTLVQLEA